MGVLRWSRDTFLLDARNTEGEGGELALFAWDHASNTNRSDVHPTWLIQPLIKQTLTEPRDQRTHAY